MAKNRYSHSQFMSKLVQKGFNFSKIKIEGVYLSGKTPIQCHCLVCGYLWNPIPANLLRGTGCPNCAGKTLDNSKFLDRLRDNNSHFCNIEFLEPYRGYNYTISCKCKKCGHEWKAHPSVLLNGCGCSRCGNKEKGINKIISHAAFEEKFKRLPNASKIELLDTFHGYKEKIKCRCKLCNHIWFPLGDNLLKGKGCPNCSHMQTSFAEQFIFLALCSQLGNQEVLSREKKIIGREIDIYIPRYKFALEIGSWYWHQKRIASDYDKYIRCKNIGIELWTIFDGCSLGRIHISTPPFENCSIFQQDLGSEENHATLKEIVCKILAKFGLNIDITDKEWSLIDKKASLSSHIRSDQDFRLEVQQKNPNAGNIEILEKFTGGAKKIHCRCMACGHEWYPRAQNLLSGHGCPECQRKNGSILKRKKKDDFLFEFQKNNTHAKDILLLGQYVAMTKKILCKCNICGHIWEPLAINLARLGTGCPRCARRHNSRMRNLS